MAEPKTRADRIETVFPWLLHWTIADERLEGYRSDSYAVRTPGGTLLIDPVALEDRLQAELAEVTGVLLTHRDHQRAAWRMRKELGAPVYAPAGDSGLDEEPDVLIEPSTPLPGGLGAVRATAFDGACYLTFTHADDTGVLFCGDLICREPDGPYRFPVQPGYFDLEKGRADARRLLELPATVLCAAHAPPGLGDCRAILENAVRR